MTFMDHRNSTFFLSLTLTLLLLLPAFSNAFPKPSIKTDESALLTLKSHVSLDSNSTQMLSNWTEGTSVCTWIGVRCSSLHTRVVALNVSDLGLHGTIPPQVGNLSFLGSIDISSNNFRGELPREIANLRRLKYMDFSVNSISGDIPGWFGSLSDLRHLDLGNNTLSGALQSSFFNATKLEYVSLDSNQLNGRIPAQVGNLRNLRYISMEHNLRVEGSLPLSFFNLSSLQIMGFTNNRLNGELPLHICSNLPNLTGIHLSLNQFSGSLQSRLDNCSKLRILSLSYNSFTGLIPKEIGNLTELNSLFGGYNRFQGGIPPEIGYLRNLEFMSFQNSSLSGEIPVEFRNLESLTYLSMNYNFLSGPIPQSLFNLSSLYYISLVANNLTGTLPHDIGIRLPNLQKLKLMDNRLSGTVPNSISNLSKLDNLGLAVNQFTGPIPSSLGNMGFLESLTNCRYLERISITRNPLNIPLLPSIALDYLHHGNISPIVHCDLKPSNVLIDEEMTGHVSDFGISKLLAGDETMVQTTTLATIGYTAPEYGSEGLVSTRCDIYSFGILLMETFTRMKPTDEMFGEGFGLREMIKDSLQSSKTEFIDQNLINAEDQKSKEIVHSTPSVPL